MKKFISLLLVTVLTLSLTACTTQTNEEFDPTEYIKAVLDNTYLNKTEDYMKVTGADAEDASEVHHATVYNLVVKFFDKYEVNPDESQMAELEAIFSSIYEKCDYTVSSAVEHENEYFVTVSYNPITSIAVLNDEIYDIKDNAGDELYDVGASYIDDIIDLCEQAGSNIDYSSNEEQVIDLIVNNANEIMLNITKLTAIDELIFLI